MTTLNENEVLTIENMDYSEKEIDYNIPSNVKHILFKSCKFHNIVFNGDYKFSCSFEDCGINDIDIYLLLNSVSFVNSSIGKVKISSHKIDHAVSFINTKDKMNLTPIGTFTIYVNEFIGNFTISNIQIYYFAIWDTHFKSICDLTKVTVLTESELENIDFDKAVIFDDCIFYNNTTFKYVLFNDFSYFRGTEFKGYLNLEYISSEKLMNFYNVIIGDKLNTSQETFRIIKHNFEKLGNKIEANKYHALELEQKGKKLREEKGDWKEQLVFNIHNWSSEHSTNWFRALLWIVIVGFITMIFVNFGIVKDLFFNPSNFKIEYIFKAWNEFWKFIYIGYMEDDLKSNPLTFLFNKVSLGYLYYQFLISVRKDTRK